MKKQIINIDSLEFKGFPVPLPDNVKEKMEGAVMARASTEIGAQKLGYSVIKVPPQKRAYQFHNHQVNEELFFILEGKGEVRIGEKTYPVKKGDFIAHPPGGKETAHQIINTGTEELVYIGVSTQETPEIVDYPDSNKFGVMHTQGQNPDGSPKQFRFLGREEDSLDYFDGE